MNEGIKIAREEMFGPVISIFKYKDYDEVIERANDTDYGLGAGILTKDIETYFKLFNGLRVGSVWVSR